MSAMKFIFCFLMLFTALSCSKSDEDLKDRHSLILEKTWYNNPNMGLGNHHFSSDGQIYVDNPAWIGTFYWGPNDSMYIEKYDGSKLTYWFRYISEDSISFWPTHDFPQTFYSFTTTKP